MGQNVVDNHRWRIHKRDWENCTLCPLHEYAHKHVLFRGTIPCDILFVGEAPGRTEDTLGEPFIGRAGKLLDDMWECVRHEIYLAKHYSHIEYAITNVVACIPFPPESDIVPPSKEHITICNPRLVDFIDIAKPKLLVALGEVSKRALKPYNSRAGITLAHLYHPSYILRKGGQSSVEFKKWVHQLVGLIIEHKVGIHDNPKTVRKAKQTR